MNDDWCRPTFGHHLPDWDRCHDEATQPVDRPQPRSGKMDFLGMSLYSGWRGS
jgi:hypothetical protein